MTAPVCLWPELLLTQSQLLAGDWSDSVEPPAKSGSQEQSSDPLAGVLGALPSKDHSPPCMFSVFNRPWSIDKGWQGVLGYETAPRHRWALHPSGVPSHHFPGTKFSRLLLSPNWLYTKRSLLGWEYVHLELNLLATSGCRGPPPLELPTATTNNMGRKGRWFFLMTVVREPSGSKCTAASHAPAPPEEHQSEERGFPLEL